MDETTIDKAKSIVEKYSIIGGIVGAILGGGGAVAQAYFSDASSTSQLYIGEHPITSAEAYLIPIFAIVGAGIFNNIGKIVGAWRATKKYPQYSADDVLKD
jgi:hypothetical protein